MKVLDYFLKALQCTGILINPLQCSSN